MPYTKNTIKKLCLCICNSKLIISKKTTDLKITLKIEYLLLCYRYELCRKDALKTYN